MPADIDVEKGPLVASDSVLSERIKLVFRSKIILPSLGSIGQDGYPESSFAKIERGLLNKKRATMLKPAKAVRIDINLYKFFMILADYAFF
ncbi:MAG: hypothetical protein COX06_02495 [Candidatus Zambryskibacteria bacterium CG22_combo_CG10-13_8_21_14_all_42_17]|uniref:Uncharacterized protein n=1 Tax=Candidatus Zambryskibacteria bacterium CG22_combo_CG10-13_8_21_14_all_42_17 TaxID=1975118 RepID=A0A2H0BD26_9BACT|nr:MAG: hypothetical protein COX06_02495 [Candidatus Zambryskibacteria bacterium CG22_combo_CG10-13_8_21_14_all_42_17]